MLIFYIEVVNKIRKEATKSNSASGRTKSFTSTRQDTSVDTEGTEGDSKIIEGAFEDGMQDFENKYRSILHRQSIDDSSILSDEKSFREFLAAPQNLSSSLVDSKKNSPNLMPQQGSSPTLGPNSLEVPYLQSDISKEIGHSPDLEGSPKIAVKDIASVDRSESSPQLPLIEVRNDSFLEAQASIATDTTLPEIGSEELSKREKIKNHIKNAGESIKYEIKRHHRTVSSKTDTEQNKRSFGNSEKDNNLQIDGDNRSQSIIEEQPSTVDGSERRRKGTLESDDKMEKAKKEEDTPAVPRRRARGLSTNVKEIPNFSGIMLVLSIIYLINFRYMRMSSEKKWNKYFARITGSCINLYKSILVYYINIFT